MQKIFCNLCFGLKIRETKYIIDIDGRCNLRVRAQGVGVGVNREMLVLWRKFLRMYISGFSNEFLKN